jgi:hypothetical protein
MKYGAQTDRYVDKTFSWYPTWIWIFIVLGVLVPLIVAMCISKRMKVDAPMCDVHRNHWKWRSRFVWFGLLAVLIFGLSALIVYIDLTPQNPPDATITIWTIIRITWLTVSVAWLIGAAIFALAAVRPFEITDDDITLGNLSPDFVQALQIDRERYEEKRRERKRNQQDPDCQEQEGQAAPGARQRAVSPNWRDC